MKLLLLLLTIEVCTAKDTVPVFILDHGRAMSYRSIEPDPLKKIATKTFSSIAKEAMQKAECVIIFLEEHLCTEDITSKDKKGSPYTNLQLELLKKNVKYLPAVEYPYKTLTRFFKPMPFNVFHLSSGGQLKLKDDSFKYIYVVFSDIKPNQTRTESLRRHDMMMKEVYSIVKEKKRTVAIYTGRVNPIVLEKFQYVPRPIETPEMKSVFVPTEGALFRFSGVYASNSKRRSEFNQMPMVSSETFSRRKLSTTMTYAEFDLQFNFGFGEAEWTLDTVILLEGGEEVGRRLMQVGAPWNWSYTCGEPLCIVNDRDGSVVTVSQYQIQPIYPEIQRRSWTLDGDEELTVTPSPIRDFRVPYIMDSNKHNSNSNIHHYNFRRNNEFGQTVNCGPYFSISILSGLFVVYTCLGVMGYGILMLISCGSNDRFDDPHGKEVFTVTGDDNTVILLEGGEEVGRRLMQVGAPWNWSYTCGEPLCIVNDRDGSVVTVSQYQIQPIYPEIQRRSWTLDGDEELTVTPSPIRDFRVPYIMDSNKHNSNSNIHHYNFRRNNEFGQTVNCGPYFSISILSGLFVVYTCLGVMGYGILMLISCGSNDRFDDPHGKEVFTVTGDDSK